MSPVNVLIIDGYPKSARDDLEQAGMTLAWKLYVMMLRKSLPDATYSIWLPSDTAMLPGDGSLDQYDAVLWTGCNLSIYDTSDERVTRQIELARKAYELGLPSFGTCWGLQIAAVAAGGNVQPNPKGREMGIARKIHLTDAGRSHPLMEGKPPVFDGFISHEDEVVALPLGATLLAGNDFTAVQALEVKYKRGTFWALQYHPEYNLHEIARLTVAREEKLIKGGFFQSPEALSTYVEHLETLAAQPQRKDLRWQLGIDDDVLDDGLRQLEFRNFIYKLLLPGL